MLKINGARIQKEYTQNYLITLNKYLNLKYLHYFMESLQ
jgi:hypothetical protein